MLLPGFRLRQRRQPLQRQGGLRPVRWPTHHLQREAVHCSGRAGDPLQYHCSVWEGDWLCGDHGQPRQDLPPSTKSKEILVASPRDLFVRSIAVTATGGLRGKTSLMFAEAPGWSSRFLDRVASTPKAFGPSAQKADVMQDRSYCAMSSGATGPPPGFEDVRHVSGGQAASPEPPDVPPAPNLGTGRSTTEECGDAAAPDLEKQGGHKALLPRGLRVVSAASLRREITAMMTTAVAVGVRRRARQRGDEDEIHGVTTIHGNKHNRPAGTKMGRTLIDGARIPTPTGGMTTARGIEDAQGAMDYMIRAAITVIPGQMVETDSLEGTIIRITIEPGPMTGTKDQLPHGPVGYMIRTAIAVIPGQMVEITGIVGAIMEIIEDCGKTRLRAMISTPPSRGRRARALRGTPGSRGMEPDTEDLGSSARSYLRQVSAWRQMTLLPQSQQGLVLYQGLTGKAWIAAEELSVSRLGDDSGIDYFISWVSARFLDLETIREFNTEYDRLFGRLREVGCNLPQEAAAWMYLDRLQLEEAQELNLLASVGNRYDLLRLQQAAILHDRGQRKPWESANKGRKPNYAHVTFNEQDDSDGPGDEFEGEGIPEEVAEACRVTYQSAKERYRTQQKARGYSGETGENGTKANGGDGDRDKGDAKDGGREAKLKMMKSKSFCSGCGRRGHWHRDGCCPLNQNGNGGAKPEGGLSDVAMTTVLPSDVFALRHVADLVGVTDTACARTVAGSQWLQAYTDKLSEQGQRPVLRKETEAYRFGTGKIHYSSFYVVVNFELGDCVLQVRTSIITGDIPLLLSKTVLGKMGMVFNVEEGTADFTKIGLRNYKLLTTSSGHPAIPIVPAKADSTSPVLQVEDVRLQPKEQYMSVCAVACKSSVTPQYTGIYHEKKLAPGDEQAFPLLWIGRAVLYKTQPIAVSTPSAAGDAPCDSPKQQKTLSRMTKAELLEEAMRLGMVVHPSWTVIELRAVIREFLAETTDGDVAKQMKKINSLNLDELKEKARELSVDLPTKATKGQILKLIRESLNTPDNTLMTIGRWRGSEYQEIPPSYGRWAVEEIRRSSNAHPDLVRFGRWRENASKAKIPDEDVDASYVTPRNRSSGSAKDSWEAVSATTSLVTENTKGKGNVKAAKRTTSDAKDRSGYMDSQPDETVQAEIAALELKLAVLKDKARGRQRGYAEIYVNEHHEHYDHVSGTRAEADDYKLLSDVIGSKPGPLRAIHTDPTFEDHAYVTLGMFTHGGVHGVTRATQELDGLVRYLNHFGKAHLPSEASWTSISVTQDVGTEVHRDSNNLRGSSNFCVTFGQGSGGNLWLETKDLDEAQANGLGIIWKRDKVGAWIPGRTYDNVEKFVEFDPHLKHCSNPWTGQRWCVTYHSVRGAGECGQETKKFLRNCGFPLPRDGHGPGGRPIMRKKTPKRVRSTVMNNAAKVSVLMATLLSTTMSFLGEFRGPEPETDPIVMFEIGGYEGTLEAVELGKAVIEPITWEDYVDPNVQSNAHHVITGASPKELRIHLAGMPDRVGDSVRDLIKDQIDGGDEVVLRGGDPNSYLKTFEEFVQYKSLEEDDKWVVFGKNKKDTKLLGDGVVPQSEPEAAVAASSLQCSECKKNLLPEVCVVNVSGEKEIKYDGSGITFQDGVPGVVQSSLRRLHQNLGHPRAEDLCRHLRLAGCEPHIIKAVKGMKCETCEATKGAQVARPTTLPRLLDFNSCVGIDLMYVHDANDVRHTFLTMVDWATTYQVVAKLDRETGPDVEKAFNNMWITPFGPPTAVSIDLDGKVQAGVARLCDWHNIKTRDVAAQAKWQGGVTERQIGWFKGIWDRVNYELNLQEDDIEIAGTLVCAAKNELQGRCGHSPVQWVFGRSPRLPSELQDPDGDEGVTWDLTQDSKFQRIAAIRASARVAFHKAQGDDRLRRGLMQRARTRKQDFDIGDPVHFWNQPKDRRRPHWAGPAVVVGKQGNNYWISRSGRCRLTAPEHLRSSGPEELGEFLTMKGVRQEVNRLLEEDVDDMDIFEGEAEKNHESYEDHLSDYEPSLPDEIELDGEGDHVMAEEKPTAELPAPVQPPPFRVKRKSRPVNEDGGADEQMAPANAEIMMVKKALTTRGQAKRQEKELKWGEIPPHAKEKFKAAEKVQWDEHLSYDALEPLSVEASREIRNTVDKSRILTCRWAYRDKNWSARQAWLANKDDKEAEPDWKCKSRLVIGGHRDPDLGVENLSTDAPTLSRPGFLCMMQRLADGQLETDPWRASAGDIQCAFLTGGYLSREEPLYLSQPSTGFPGLLPEQLVHIKKNIFGLATSPLEWWEDLQNGIFKIMIHHGNEDYAFEACPLDPCIFMLRRMTSTGFAGPPIGYLGTHVDDLLVIASGKVGQLIRDALSASFPVDRWEHDCFEYVGSEIRCENGAVTVTQRKYAENRLFLLDVPTGCSDEDRVDAELRADNQSLIGALSWLAAQTRPDLTCSVSLAQQLQKDPTIGDVKFTNQVSVRAVMHKDRGLKFQPIPKEYFGVIVYHDAAWANALEAEHEMKTGSS
ncbi:RE2 [Symbiodinium sp. CCMP2592]|nr:RE2 [Symbiodinium sp. CCMP2592]